MVQGLLIPLQPLYEKDSDTPRKTRDTLSRSYYLETSETPFPPDCLSRMKSTADDVLDEAMRNRKEGAHEKQWGALVCQLLCEVRIWQKRPKQVVVLNV